MRHDCFVSNDRQDPVSTLENLLGLRAPGDASAAGDLSQTTGGIRKDTATDLAGADGNYAPVQLDPVGNLRVVQGAATPAGGNEIGKTNIKHFNIAATGGGVLTRPANMTAYTAADSVSDNATAGSVTALPVTIADADDNPIDLIEILLDCDDTGFGTAQFRMHLFESDPTANSGVQAGDNAAWSQKRAGWVGSFSGTMTAFFDGCRAVMTPDGPSVKIANVESSGRRLWWQLQILSAATPAQNSSVFTPRFKGYQGRP